MAKIVWTAPEGARQARKEDLIDVAKAIGVVDVDERTPVVELRAKLRAKLEEPLKA